MKLVGGCYCGALRYEAGGKPMLKAQCHCRACQHVSGGGPNLFMLVKPDEFRFTKGEPKTFKRQDLENGVTRQFCAACGTHIASLRPGLPAVVLKIGTLDSPADFGGPVIAIFTAEMAPFHHIPDGMPAFEGLPPKP
jgi:hypothetical protein